MGILLRWLLSAAALVLTVKIGEMLGFGIRLTNLVSSLIAVLALAIVNVLIGKLVRKGTSCVNCLTLGISGFVINALLFWLVGSFKETGLVVENFWAALYGSVVYSILSASINRFVKMRQERDQEES